MFQDEARFGRITDIRRAWAPYPLRPICCAMLTHEYTYAYAAVDADSGHLDSLILLHVNTDCMRIFLEEVASRHPDEKIVMVLDGTGWHASKTLRVRRTISACCPCPRMRQNLIRWSTFGRNCARNSSTTLCLTQSMLSKITSKPLCVPLNRSVTVSAQLLGDRGLLMYF